MARTPDRTPGPSLEEETQYEDRGAGNDPTVDGALRYVDGNFRMKDGLGVFNPRTGAGGGLTPLEDLLFTSDLCVIVVGCDYVTHS